MLTALQPDLPTIPTQVGGATLVERVASLELALKEDRRRFLEAMRGMWDTLNQDGALDIVQARITASHGVIFPATQNASTDVNTLDDYEEGTFSPGVSFGGGTTGITYTSQAGKYTKIGNVVVVHGLVALSAKGSSAGAARLTGLPFTVRNNADSDVPGNVLPSAITFTGQMFIYAEKNTTTVAFAKCTEAGAFAVLDDTNFSNASAFNFMLVYSATA